MIGKRFAREVRDGKFVVVEVLSESKTHVYIKMVEPVGAELKENIPKKYFVGNYVGVEELVDKV